MITQKVCSMHLYVTNKHVIVSKTTFIENGRIYGHFYYEPRFHAGQIETCADLGSRAEMRLAPYQDLLLLGPTVICENFILLSLI